MECPRTNCHGETTVVATVANHDHIDRTRRCKRCGYKFTTTEIRSASILRVLERVGGEEQVEYGVREGRNG